MRLPVPRHLAWAVVPLLAAVAPPERVPGCRDDRGQDRCAAAALADQRALYDAAPIETFAARREPIIRAFFVDGYGRDAGVVALLRPAAAEPRIEVRMPPRDGGTTRRPPLSAPISAAQWESLVYDSRFFDRMLAVQPGEQASICLHSWVVTIEASDQAGRIRRRTEDACRGALTMDYGFVLARAAIAAIPPCALLDPERTRNDVSRLAACATLEGDRAAAALALNAFESPWFNAPQGPDFARAIQPLFSERVDFAWPGLAPVGTAQAASEIWAREAARNRFYPRRVFGETADRVRIEGEILLWQGGTGAPKSVPAMMLWTRETGAGFRLRRLESGTGR